MLDKISNEKVWQSFIRHSSIKPFQKDHKEILKELKELVVKSIKKNIPNEKFGILFSGGVDSTLIAQVCKKEKKDFVCYTTALKEKGLKQAEDLTYAKKAAKKLALKLKIKTINLNETEKYIKKILKILKEPNVVKVGVALPFYIAFEMAKKDRIRVMFSGLGSEELFAGYQRHEKAKNINKECFNGLLNMYERDISRDLAIAKAQNVNLRVPYLEKELIGYALRIPAEFKLSILSNVPEGHKKSKTFFRESEKGLENSKNFQKNQNKLILREVAEQLGLKEFAWRKKRAAQYGSKFDRAIEKLAKRNGFKYKKDYLVSLLK